MIRYFKVLLVVSLLFSMQAAASEYEEGTLEIASKILPRLVLMSSLQKNIKKQIDICILYDKPDAADANSLLEKIHTNYPNGLKNYPLAIKKYEFAGTNLCDQSQIAFLFNTNDQTIEKTLRILNQKGILSMSYDPAFLEKGVQSSLFLGRKVTPYLNLNALKNSKILLDPLVVQISKIYTPGDAK